MRITYRFGVVLACFLVGAALTPAQHCDQTIWQHVYHPERLRIVKARVTVTGTIVDATHGKRKDGVRHEKDGDTHGWIRPDEAGFTNAGNDATQEGNLVYEIVCLFPVTQADAKAACKGYKSPIKLAPVGSRVEITGSLVEDLQHKPVHREIHPVSSITLIPQPIPAKYHEPFPAQPANSDRSKKGITFAAKRSRHGPTRIWRARKRRDNRTVRSLAL